MTPNQNGEGQQALMNISNMLDDQHQSEDDMEVDDDMINSKRKPSTAIKMLWKARAKKIP